MSYFSAVKVDLNMLDVQNLMVFFENALALNDFSMKVEEGQIVGVIGSNSAGKTTLMNTLSGLIIDMAIKEKTQGRGTDHDLWKNSFQGRGYHRGQTERPGEEGHCSFERKTPCFS